MSAPNGHALIRTEPMPYYTLRGFLDAEYGVIVSLAFVKFVELSAGILKAIISGKLIDRLMTGEFAQAWNILGAAVAYGPSGEFSVSFIQALGSFILMFICFIMLVDDYYQARVLSFWAPCRTIKRFAMDVAIGFAFGATLLAAYHQSYLAGVFLGLSYWMGAKWGSQVKTESKEWEYEQRAGCSASPEQFGAKTTNWGLFKSRLDLINQSHKIMSGLLLLISPVFYLFEHQFGMRGLYIFYALATIISIWVVTSTFTQWEKELVEAVKDEIAKEPTLNQAQKEVATRQVVVLDSMFWLILSWLPRRLKAEYSRRWGRRQ